MERERNEKAGDEKAERVSEVLDNAIHLSSELSTAVGELAELLKNYTKEGTVGEEIQH